MKRKKKRSLRGKIRLGIAYTILICIMICIIKQVSNIFMSKTGKSNMDARSSQHSIEDVANREDVNQNIKEQKETMKSMSNTEKYKKENEFVSKITSLIVSVPYVKGGICTIDKSGEIKVDGLDSFGLVDYAYFCAKGKHLSEVNINENNISQCKQIAEKDLRIGDIGICRIGKSAVYGIYLGKDCTYPIFAYACDMSNGIYESGSVYLSYNKTSCNDIFGGMFPMDYTEFYRLPDMDFQAIGEVKIKNFLDDNVIPPKSYYECASAVYQIGEWFRTKDYSYLFSRLNEQAISNNGFILNKDMYHVYISDYLKNNNFIFRIRNYQQFAEYDIANAEVVMIGISDRTFMDSGIHIDLTIYDDGSYLPGSVFSLGKYSSFYGYSKMQKEKGNKVVTRMNITPTDGPNSLPGEENTERYIYGNGFSIDTDSIAKKQ